MQLLKMKQLEISDYQKLNDSFHKRLVYHVGIDCGFFVELNNMINAILYCLLNGYRFQLYSEDANFGTGKDGQNISCLSVRKSMSHSITSITCTVHPHGDEY